MKLNFVLSFTKNEKHYAIVKQVEQNLNLLYVFQQRYDPYLGELKIIHFAPSYKKACEIANYWNDSYKNNNDLQTL